MNTVNAQLLEALEWALSQIEDSLDPDHQAALEAAQEAAKRAHMEHELIEALRYYANPSDYEGRMVNDGRGYFDQMGYEILDDKGAVARAAITRATGETA